MPTIVFIIVYLGISIAVAIWIAVFLKGRAQRDMNSYPRDWFSFKMALETNNIREIEKYGSTVLWNSNLKKNHKEIIYNEIEKRKNLPELQKLWEDVYYMTHGVEPQ